MESTNAERRSRQPGGDGTEGSSKSSSLHPRSRSSSSTADSSLFLDSCSCKNGCTDCDYGHCDAMIWRWAKKKESARDAKARVLKSLFVLFPYERDAEPLGTTKATKKAVAKSKGTFRIRVARSRSLSRRFSIVILAYTICNCSSYLTEIYRPFRFVSFSRTKREYSRAE